MWPAIACIRNKPAEGAAAGATGQREKEKRSTSAKVQWSTRAKEGKERETVPFMTYQNDSTLPALSHPVSQALAPKWTAAKRLPDSHEWRQEAITVRTPRVSQEGSREERIHGQHSGARVNEKTGATTRESSQETKDKGNEGSRLGSWTTTAFATAKDAGNTGLQRLDSRLSFLPSLLRSPLFSLSLSPVTPDTHCQTSDSRATIDWSADSLRGGCRRESASLLRVIYRNR